MQCSSGLVGTFNASHPAKTCIQGDPTNPNGAPVIAPWPQQADGHRLPPIPAHSPRAYMPPTPPAHETLSSHQVTSSSVARTNVSCCFMFQAFVACKEVGLAATCVDTANLVGLSTSLCSNVHALRCLLCMPDSGHWPMVPPCLKVRAACSFM